MIVVVGQPLFRATDVGSRVDGLPARIALAAANAGRSVQLVGKAGEDPEGDAVVLALAAGGVGHVALLRDAGRPTLRAPISLDADPDSTEVHLDEPTEPPAESSLDATDVDLALRYLTDYAVVVLADPVPPDVVKVVADASHWVGAQLIVVVPAGQRPADGLPENVIVFEAPDGNPDGAFASLVGSYAAALDEGEGSGEAFKASIEADGWAAATD